MKKRLKKQVGWIKPFLISEKLGRYIYFYEVLSGVLNQFMVKHHLDS
jgi:hypothetical protein